MNTDDIFLTSIGLGILTFGYLISPLFFYALGFVDNYIQDRHMEKLRKSFDKR